MKTDPVELLKDLVRTDTTNPPGNEAILMEKLEEIFRQEGIPYLHQQTAPGRGNLLAWLRSEGKPQLPALVLLSHMDVVAAQAEQWQFPPFAAQEDQGYIYGRGTVDTKQLTVMELEAFLNLKGKPLCRDVYFLATSDEESGSTYGLKWFLEHTITVNEKTCTGEQLLQNSDVISEGGGFPILANGKELYLCETGQKGCGSVTFTVKARKAKGPFFGSGDGMARAMALAQDIGSRKLEGRELETVSCFREALAGSTLSPMMEKILQAMQGNTLTVTLISGRSVNEVCVTCDVRLLPGFGREYLTGILEDLARKWDCTYEITSLGQGYESSPQGEFLKILEQATLEQRGKTRQEAQVVPFVSMGSSDGHLLVDCGAHVYGYSPVLPWDMTFDTAVSMVHGVNERIHRDSVLFGCRVLTQAVEKAAKKEA